METIPERFGKALYLAVAAVLVAIGIAVIVYALYDVIQALGRGKDVVATMLDAVGLTVLALAVIDVSKYLFEEEVKRNKELRVPAEARARLTKFMTLIAIAVSLEGLVFVFSAGKKDPSLLLYPSLLLVTSAIIMVGLGAYQWLSAKSEQALAEKKK